MFQGGECLSLGHLLRTWPPAISVKTTLRFSHRSETSVCTYSVTKSYEVAHLVILNLCLGTWRVHFDDELWRGGSMSFPSIPFSGCAADPCEVFSAMFPVVSPHLRSPSVF